MNKFRTNFSFLLLIIVAFSLSCEEEDEYTYVKTHYVSNITVTSATLNGSFIYKGSGRIIRAGFVMSSNPDPDLQNTSHIYYVEDKNMDFNYTLIDLPPAGNFYVRAFVKNEAGVTYGAGVEFRTYYNLVVDIEGNEYFTTKIGNQEWMARNLLTSTFNDGNPISNISNSEWEYNNHTYIPAYCWYNDLEVYKHIYGALYNFYSVNTGKLCPQGWRVPSDVDWFELENFIDPSINDLNLYGERGVAGILLKTTHDGYWNYSGNVTDKYNFSAYPSGRRISHSGVFDDMGYRSYWWTSSIHPIVNAYSRQLGGDGIGRYSEHQNFGFSVRCMRDISE